MTSLRKKMEPDLRLRNLSAATATQYVGCVASFARHFRRSPDRLGTDEVRAFLLHLEERGLAPATRVVHHAALRFLYVETLGRPEVMATVPRPRVGPQRPGVPLVREEVHALLRAAALANQPRMYTVVATLLATGLRVSELCVLQVGDLDALAGLLHVRRGKGAKPRAVRLSEKHLRLLRRYWKVERPPGPWLFASQNLIAPGQVDPVRRWTPRPMHQDTVRTALQRLTRAAGMKRKVTPHDLRRTYATWLLEAGVDTRTVQVLLGHASPETTARYTQVRPELIRRTPSPLDML